MFDVSVNIKTLKPSLDKEFYGVVSLITDKGIFVDIGNIFKVFISLTNLNSNDYEYDTNDLFVNKKLNKIITIGEFINIQIKGVKYNQKSFNCFGVLNDVSL
jgi:exoribonuclease R